MSKCLIPWRVHSYFYGIKRLLEYIPPIPAAYFYQVFGGNLLQIARASLIESLCLSLLRGFLGCPLKPRQHHSTMVTRTFRGVRLGLYYALRLISLAAKIIFAVYIFSILIAKLKLSFLLRLVQCYRRYPYKFTHFQMYKTRIGRCSFQKILGFVYINKDI